MDDIDARPQYTPEDNTTKLFMTERGDPRAIFDVVYGCSPTGELQKELSFKARADLLGGHICVRTASQDRYEFRYSPPGNTREYLHPIYAANSRADFTL